MQETEKQTTKNSALCYLFSVFNSTVGRKTIMALSGLGLVVFTILHLLGNLTLFAPDSGPFNNYAHLLEGLGPILVILELALLLVFVIHIVFALKVTGQNKAARPERYRTSGNAGQPSQKTLYSQTMIVTGMILLFFLIMHVWMFKFGGGPFLEVGMTTLDGQQARDLHAHVVHYFSNPVWVGLYVAVMLLLGSHLRHAFWSAFQSLGVHHPRYTPVIQSTGIFLAVILAFGFLMIPIWLYIRHGLQLF